MSEYSRTQRVADQIQRELATLIQLEMKDPRLGMVTVSAVELSRDMSYAEVYVTVLEQADSAEIELTLKILSGAAGFLRTRLAKLVQLRAVPHLRFHYDESIARGQRLSALIDQAVSKDRKRPDNAVEED